MFPKVSATQKGLPFSNSYKLLCKLGEVAWGQLLIYWWILSILNIDFPSNSVILYSYSHINYVVCFAFKNRFSLSFSRNSLIVTIFISSLKFIFYKTSGFRGRKHNKPILCVRWIKIQIGDSAWLSAFSSILVSPVPHKLSMWDLEETITANIFSQHLIVEWKWRFGLANYLKNFKYCSLAVYNLNRKFHLPQWISSLLRTWLSAEHIWITFRSCHCLLNSLDNSSSGSAF